MFCFLAKAQRAQRWHVFFCDVKSCCGRDEAKCNPGDFIMAAEVTENTEVYCRSVEATLVASIGNLET